MALFKVCRGKENSIPADIQDGYIYMCTDTNNIFMDWLNVDGAEFRFQMNAEFANKLRYYDAENELIILDASVIAEHLNNKDNPHEVTADQIGLYIANVDEVESYLGINT